MKIFRRFISTCEVQIIGVQSANETPVSKRQRAGKVYWHDNSNRLLSGHWMCRKLEAGFRTSREMRWVRKSNFYMVTKLATIKRRRESRFLSFLQKAPPSIPYWLSIKPPPIYSILQLLNITRKQIIGIQIPPWGGGETTQNLQARKITILALIPEIVIKRFQDKHGSKRQRNALAWHKY